MVVHELWKPVARNLNEACGSFHQQYGTLKLWKASNLKLQLKVKKNPFNLSEYKMCIKSLRMLWNEGCINLLSKKGVY